MLKPREKDLLSVYMSKKTILSKNMINSAHSDVGLTKVLKRKTHVRTLYLYAFDRRLVDGKFEAENDGSFELAASMDQKWAYVARRIGIWKAVGSTAKKNQRWTKYDSQIGSICLYHF